MEAVARIEQALTETLARATAAGCPPKLAAAVNHAVFPGGARIRPRLCLAVAEACREDHPHVTDAAAISIELLHCASLIHDDLPCFDDAPIRRGKASVHRAFGEPIAVLAGDALIVQAFQALARVGATAPERLAPLLMIVGRAVGMPAGIVSGQAWECEPEVPLAAYQRSKTGALFAAATAAGAAAAGADHTRWRDLGARLGEAYQVADDIRDVAASSEELGKPIGQDAALGRPNAAQELGLDGAIAHLKSLVAKATDSVPPCPGDEALRSLIVTETKRFLPKSLARHAA